MTFTPPLGMKIRLKHHIQHHWQNETTGVQEANLKVLKGTVDISIATIMFISMHIGPDFFRSEPQNKMGLENLLQKMAGLRILIYEVGC